MVDDSISRSSSCRPHEVAGVEEYSGWLKKLGGKFKTWRKRFFVLRGSKLLYYTGPDEMRLLGEFSLEGTQAEMLSAENECNSDSKGYLFVVKPEDPTAFLTQTHQQFILCASNPEERKSWMRAIRKVLYLRHGGALFGTHLSEAFPFTKPEHGYHPRVVYDTTQFIRDYGMETEGIFRKCGTQHALLDLAEAYDEAAEEPILDPGQHSVHLVAGLLKYYLRELPEPVIPFRFYDRLKSTGFRIADGQDLAPLIDILESLPAPNYHLLQYLCQFLFEVAQHESTNRMSIENLASVFAPNFLRQADGDLDVEMSASSILNLTIAEFIRQHENLFRLELVPLKQLQMGIPVHTGKHTSRPTRVRHTIVSSDQIPLAGAPLPYPDVLQPTLKVEKQMASSDGDLMVRTPSRTRMPRTDQASVDYENYSEQWELRNGYSQQFDHVSPSIIPAQNCTAPPTQVTLLQLSTPRSERSCLRQMTQPAMSEYDGEEGYSTPTTTTLSSEVIGSAGGSGSLRLSSRDRHLQSSGFISCFDCPTNRSFSIGTRSPPSSSKLNGSERSERRPKLPAIWVHGQKDRVHRTTSCNGYSALPSQNLQIAKENVQRETIRRDPDTMYAEVPPKPPPFSMPSNDTRIPPVSTKVQYDCGTPPIPRPSPPQTSPSSFGNSLLGHSQSAHEFDAPNRLRPDDQIRYWRALAVSSRADAASQRARAHALVGELTRIRCDLNMAELEIGLLRKRLAAAEAELRCHYRLGLVPSSKYQVWTENWSSR